MWGIRAFEERVGELTRADETVVDAEEPLDGVRTVHTDPMCCSLMWSRSSSSVSNDS